LLFARTYRKIFDYTRESKNVIMAGILFIISSPSGGGKGTLIREVLRTVPDIGYSVSFTTRGIREGEIGGKNYYFVSPAEFERLIEQGEFLEFANVHGNYYGTSRAAVEREMRLGRDVILEIDVQGAESVRQMMPDAVSIFILPPSYTILRQRLILRRTESDESLALRLLNAHWEVKRYKEFHYVIVNNEVERATEDLKTIILAERLKFERQEQNVQDILETFENFKTNSIGD
jgi:guanylate kinase